MNRTSVAEVRTSAADDERLTFEDLARALSNLSDLVADLAQPSVDSCSPELRLRTGSILYVGDAVRALADRCDARHEETEG